MSRPLHHSLGKVDRLVVFDAVMQAGSLTQAAIALGVTQPAVSRQISLLEDDLQVVLFQRETSRITPTAEAVALAAHVDAGLTAFEAGIAEVQGQADVLTLAVQPAIAESWFAPRLAALRAAVEPTVVQLVIFEHDTDLRARDHHLAIRFGASFGRHFRSKKLIAEAVTPVASPDYAERHGLSDQSLPVELAAGPRLLHLDPTDRQWMDWRQWYELAGYPDVVGDADIVHPNYGILLQQALAGQGVVLGWQTQLGDLVTRRLLVPVGPTVRRPHLGYHLVWPPSMARHAGLDRLRRWLLTTVTELADEA